MKAFMELETQRPDPKELHRLYGYEGVPGTDRVFKAVLSTWIAEIIGSDPQCGLARKFLRCKRDVSRSNSRGTRGNYAEYILESGKLYEVKHIQSRYFCIVNNDGDIIRLSKEEAESWLKDNLT